MHASIRSLLALLPLAMSMSIMSCSGSDSTRPVPPAIPRTTTLALGAVITDSLESERSAFFRIPVTMAVAPVALLESLGGTLGIRSFERDSTFTNSGGAWVGSDTTHLKQIAGPPGTGDWYVQVTAAAAATPARYRLSAHPAASGAGVPSPEGSSSAPVVLSLGVPFNGQVGTRSSSSYRVEGLLPGQTYSVVLFSLTGDVDLFAAGCPSPQSNRTLSTEPMECGGITVDAPGIQVDCGPVNRDGARYWIWVR